MRLVDPIDEDQVRNPEFVERAERWRREGRTGRVGIDDDDGDIRNREGLRAIGRKADGAGHIEDGEILAEILEVVEVELGRAAALPTFRTRIADAGAVGRRP